MPNDLRESQFEASGMACPMKECGGRGGALVEAGSQISHGARIQLASVLALDVAASGAPPHETIFSRRHDADQRNRTAELVPYEKKEAQD